MDVRHDQNSFKYGPLWLAAYIKKLKVLNGPFFSYLFCLFLVFSIQTLQFLQQINESKCESSVSDTGIWSKDLLNTSLLPLPPDQASRLRRLKCCTESSLSDWAVLKCKAEKTIPYR